MFFSHDSSEFLVGFISVHLISIAAFLTESSFPAFLCAPCLGLRRTPDGWRYRASGPTITSCIAIIFCAKYVRHLNKDRHHVDFVSSLTDAQLTPVFCESSFNSSPCGWASDMESGYLIFIKTALCRRNLSFPQRNTTGSW